jgi:G protein beta subunit-like protein
MYSSSEDGTVKIWDLRAPGPQREFEHKASVNHVALHPFNQHELISGDQQGNIRVWDLRLGACSCELVPEVGVPVRSLTIAPDGSLVVAANNNGTCYVWKMIQGVQASQFEPLHKLKAHSSYILKCLLSPDCRQLATTSSDKTIKLFNLDTFTLDRTLVGHHRWVWDAVFSVDAAYLVTASSDATSRLWDLSTGESIRVYQGHHKAICCCALNDSAL